MGGVVNAVTDTIGGILGTNKKAPQAPSAAALGFNQGQYDNYSKQRDAMLKQYQQLGQDTNTQQQGFINQMQGLQGGYAPLRGQIAGYAQGMGGLRDNYGMLNTQIGQQMQGIGGGIRGFGDISNDMAGTLAGFKGLGGRSQGLEGQYQGLNQALGGLGSGVNAIGSNRGGIMGRMNNLEGQIGNISGMSEDIRKRMASAGNEYRGLGNQMSGIDTDLSGDIGTVRQSGQDVAGLAGDIATLRGQAADQYTDTDALRGVAQRLRQGQEGMIKDAAGLQAQAGDIKALTQDQGMYAGLAEQARKGQEKGMEEAQRRAIAQSGGDARDAQRMLAGAAQERKTAGAEAARQDQLTAANQSIQNRQGMMSQQGGFLGQRSGLNQAAQAGVGNEANLLAQRGNALGMQADLTGRQAGLLGQAGQSAAQAAGLTAQQAGLQSGMLSNQANMIGNRLNALGAESGQVGQMLGAQGQIAGLLGQQGSLNNSALNDVQARASLLGQQGQNLEAQSNLLGQQAGFLNNTLAGQGMRGSMLGNQMAGYGQQLGALGQMGQNYGQMGNLYNNQIGAAMNQGQMLNNQGTMLASMGAMGLNNAGFMGQMYDRQLQDYVARQNAMDQAKLASMGMQQQSNMAAYNQPSTFDKLAGVAVPIASAALMGPLLSDIRVKDQIRNEGSEMDQFLSSLQPQSFVYKADPTQDRHYGIMAQDLEQTAAGASTVVDAPDGVKMVDLQRLVPLMAAAMGRMAQRIEELERSR